MGTKVSNSRMCDGAQARKLQHKGAQTLSSARLKSQVLPPAHDSKGEWRGQVAIGRNQRGGHGCGGPHTRAPAPGRLALARPGCSTLHGQSRVLSTCPCGGLPRPPARMPRPRTHAAWRPGPGCTLWAAMAPASRPPAAAAGCALVPACRRAVCAFREDYSDSPS